MQNKTYIVLLFHSLLFKKFAISSISDVTIENDGQETLKFVQMIFRHGDKNPEISYPNDPYKNELLWPGGWNNITDKGKHRMYDLGVYFRKRYALLLSAENLQHEIDVTSSDTDRTKISASAFVAGLRDGNSESQWNNGLHWNLLQIKTLEKKHDRYIEVTEPCAKMGRLQKYVVYNSSFANKILEDNKEMVDYIVTHSGITKTNLFTVSYVIHTLQIEEAIGLELPPWTKPVLEYKPLTEVVMKIHWEFHANKKWTFLRSGPLAQKLISNMEDFIRREEENIPDGKKMILFSGHDRTIVDMMLALHIYHSDIPQPPPFGATLIFELHQDHENKHFLNVLYKNDTSETPYKLTIPSCGNRCYISDFKTIVDKFILGDWEQECKENKFLNNSLKGLDLHKDSKFSVDVHLPLILFCSAILLIGGMIFINGQ